MGKGLDEYIAIQNDEPVVNHTDGSIMRRQDKTQHKGNQKNKSRLMMHKRVLRNAKRDMA